MSLVDLPILAAVFGVGLASIAYAAADGLRRAPVAGPASKTRATGRKASDMSGASHA